MTYPKGYNAEAVVDLILCLIRFVEKQPEDELKQRLLDDLNELQDRVEEDL